MTNHDGPSINLQSVRSKAKAHGLNTDDVYRSIAYNQLLARLEAMSVDFILKGGQALHVRGATSRTTKDIDIRGDVSDAHAAVVALIEAAELALGDGLTFTAKAEPKMLAGQQTGGYAGLHIGFVVTVGAQHMAHISVDVVAGREPTGQVELARFPLPFDIPGFPSASVAVYPVEDHLADKVSATMSTFGNDGESSRVRDLYDICAIARTAAIDASTLRQALEEERLRRELPAYDQLEIPPQWATRWPRLHREFGSESHVPAAFVEAVALAKALIDPVLTGAVTGGTWAKGRDSWMV
jgi:hypothetical protein